MIRLLLALLGLAFEYIISRIDARRSTTANLGGNFRLTHGLRERERERMKTAAKGEGERQDERCSTQNDKSTLVEERSGRCELDFKD